MNARRTLTIMATALIILAAAPGWTQNVEVDKQQRQMLLAASTAEILQKELDRAGELGFRAMIATTRGNSELVLLLERDPAAIQRLEYRLIGTNATGTFQQEIAKASKEGFRAVGPTFLNKSQVLGAEIVVVMIRAPKTTRRYEYKLLATNQTSALEKEWTAASTLGYAAIGMLTRSEVMLLMEREVK